MTVDEARNQAKRAKLRKIKIKAPTQQVSGHALKAPGPSAYAPAAKALKRNSNPVAASIALPALHRPIRPCGPWDVTKTATAQLHDVQAISFTATPVDPKSMFEPGEYFAAVSRDPLHASVQMKVSPGTVRYNCSPYCTETVILDQNSDWGSKHIYDVKSGVNKLELCIAQCNPILGGAQAHGPVYYPFQQNGRSAVWLAATPNNPMIMEFRSLAAAGSTLPWGSTWNFRTFKWTGAGWDTFDSVKNIGSSDTDFLFASVLYENGYYSFELESTYDGPLNGAWNGRLLFYGAADTLGFLPLPHLADHYTTITDILVNGASIMLSPNSAELSAAGTLVGSASSGVEDFDDLIKYDLVTDRPNASVFPYKKGIYGFAKPSSDEEMKPVSPFLRIDADSGIVTNTPIMGHGWTNVVASVPLTGNIPNTAPSGTMYLTLNFGVVYGTTNQWHQQLIPKYGYEEYTRLLRVVRTLDQWHENPMHVRDITRFLKGTGIRALKLAPSLLRLLATFAPGPYRPLLEGMEMAAVGANGLFFD
jgi:hypothetical protein